MIRLLCTVLTLGLPLIATAQINQRLKAELDSMYMLDQKYREYLANLNMSQTLKDSLQQAFGVSAGQLNGVLWRQQSRIDSSNLQRAEAILQQYGYPGKSLVGDPANKTVWFIIQHSQKIKQYLPLIRQAGEKREIPFSLVATMEDRWLMYNMQPQIYGTQGACRTTKGDKPTMECFIWPLKDPKRVNRLRKKAGFKDTIEENAARMSISYAVLTLDQVKEMYLFD